MSLCRYVAFVQFAIYQPLMSVFLVFESVIVSLSISYLVPFTPIVLISFLLGPFGLSLFLFEARKGTGCFYVCLDSTEMTDILGRFSVAWL